MGKNKISDSYLLDEVNTGVILTEPTDKSWWAGAIDFEDRVDVWTDYLPSGEKQRGRFDTMACVSYSALNVLEVQVNWMIAENKLPAPTLRFLEDGGFVENGKVNFSDRYIARLSNTTRSGNSGDNVWNAIREYGLVSERDWMFEGDFNWNEYYADIPQDVIDKGQEFLKYFDINYERLLHGIATYDEDLMKYHLHHAPIQIFTRVCAGWSTDDPIKGCGPYPTQHATTLYGIENVHLILDHYTPFLKELELTYDIPYAFRGIIKAKEIEMAVNEGNANGILYAITKKSDNPEKKALADALNGGDQNGVTQIIEGAILNKIKEVK